MGRFGVIAWWKVKRELRRLGHQLISISILPFEPFFKWRHDKNFYQNTRFTGGLTAPLPKVAIYLIYQPRGILDSTIETCAHLVTKGYAVLLVSNAPVTEIDKQRLLPYVWRIAERSNYGYDFGGYRDGIRILTDAKIDLDSLIMLNDSIWWPLFDNDYIIDDLESSGCDFGGIILNHAKQGNRIVPVIESFFFLMNQKVFNSPQFLNFWKNYKLINSKHHAVHRGERKFTGEISTGGFSIFGIVSKNRILEKIDEWDAEKIAKTLKYAIYGDLRNQDNPKLEHLNNLDINLSAEDALNELKKIIDHRNFHTPISTSLIENFGATIMKKSAGKSNTDIFHIARSKVLAASAAGDLPPLRPAVLKEMLERQNGDVSAVGR